MGLFRKKRIEEEVMEPVDPMTEDNFGLRKPKKKAVEEPVEESGETNQETPEEEKPKSNKAGKMIMSVLSGNILSQSEVRKTYPYLLFIAFLAFLYIGNVFRMQHMHRRHERLTKEVNELRSQSMTLASEKMKATRQSSIIREIERRGLGMKESLEPNKVVKD